MKTAIKYGRKSFSLEDVIRALRSKDFEIKKDKKFGNSTGEGLQVRGRPDKRNNPQGKKNFSIGICWFCKNEGHIRKNCPLRKKNQENYFENSSAANLTDGYNSGYTNGYDCGEGLIISNLSPGDESILDSGCTFHMTPRRDWLINYKPIEGGKVLMGNDQSCSVTGSRSIRFKL